MLFLMTRSLFWNFNPKFEKNPIQNEGWGGSKSKVIIRRKIKEQTPIDAAKILLKGGLWSFIV